MLSTLSRATSCSVCKILLCRKVLCRWRKFRGLKKTQQETVTLQTSGRLDSKPIFCLQTDSWAYLSQTDRQSANSLRTVSPSAVNLWNYWSSLSTETIQEDIRPILPRNVAEGKAALPLRHGHHPETSPLLIYQDSSDPSFPTAPAWKMSTRGPMTEDPPESLTLITAVFSRLWVFELLMDCASCFHLFLHWFLSWQNKRKSLFL